MIGLKTTLTVSCKQSGSIRDWNIVQGGTITAISSQNTPHLPMLYNSSLSLKSFAELGSSLFNSFSVTGGLRNGLGLELGFKYFRTW